MFLFDQTGIGAQKGITLISHISSRSFVELENFWWRFSGWCRACFRQHALDIRRAILNFQIARFTEASASAHIIANEWFRIFTCRRTRGAAGLVDLIRAALRYWWSWHWSGSSGSAFSRRSASLGRKIDLISGFASAAGNAAHGASGWWSLTAWWAAGRMTRGENFIFTACCGLKHASGRSGTHFQEGFLPELVVRLLLLVRKIPLIEGQLPGITQKRAPF